MASWLLISLMLCMATICHGQKSYFGWSLMKIYPLDEGQVQSVNELVDAEQAELQVWKRGTPEHSFNIFMSPAATPLITAKLDKLGIKYNITLKNAQTALNAEKIPQSSKTRTLFGVANAAWFTKYLTLDDIISNLQKLASSSPSLLQLETIGYGHEGNPIVVAKVSSKSGNPAFLLDAGIHAREWITPATALYVLNKLVTRYNKSSEIKNLVDSASWYIIPVLNPDGYKYTHTTDRMWRKNRRSNDCDNSVEKCCEGVDLNRNFDYNFGGPGTSPDTCEEIYCGTSAFSEPESQALRDFIQSHPEIKAYVTMHAYSQMWFYPFGDKKGSYPPNVEELITIANNGAQALKKVNGTQYQVGTPADILYEAAGGSDDWAKGVADVPYVFGMELRPDEDSGDGFILPTSQIVPTAEETWAGLNVVANAVIDKYGNKGN